jgi:hypothetical protein
MGSAPPRFRPLSAGGLSQRDRLAGHFQSLTLGRASGSMTGISPRLRIGPGD